MATCRTQTPRYANINDTHNSKPHTQSTKTLLTSASLQTPSPSFPPTFAGSLIHPASVPTNSLNTLSLSLPYTRPFGSTTGSFSTILFVWCAYGTLRASSLSSVLQMGQTLLEGVVEGVRVEWQAGVFRAERPAERAMWSNGRGGRE